MISSISSSSSTMSMMRSSAMQRPPSQGKDAFQLSDTDGNGLVSKSELATLTSEISKVTGSSINVDDALSTNDTDQDGSLSGEELLQMLTGMGFSPSEVTPGEGEESSSKPPPPPPPREQAISAYSNNSGEDDSLAQLLELLQNQENTGTSTYSSVDVTS
ncbi:EF-hand domain-containing protein [Desulfopila sp. IMCC35006]|uniref:EF-hand domain-containing protein n=1 Tax=Desulfopila sp. IMCC35006 TaxID=2569542 RepID=UPI0010AC01EA|nr:EF-hand domain-containing protein [Desulfopila sp. IMCC35006]TKB24808.1 EF-hand domain-containing protein [Desulfopila sp. IMCC35006]